MPLKINLIAAVCEGGGIGCNGKLPWNLKGEMAYFKKMTTSQQPDASGKKNVVIMGRKTWDSIPSKFRPLANRVNVVISSTMESNNEEDANKDLMVFRSLSSALSALAMPPYTEFCADVWVIGGSSLYKECIEHPNCHRLYITHILKAYECDTFFPSIPKWFTPVEVEDIPKGKQVEDAVEYEYKVYEATNKFKNGTD